MPNTWCTPLHTVIFILSSYMKGYIEYQSKDEQFVKDEKRKAPSEQSKESLQIFASSLVVIPKPYYRFFFKSFFVISLRMFTSLENSVSLFWLLGYLFSRSRLLLRFVILIPPLITIRIYFVHSTFFYLWEWENFNP